MYALIPREDVMLQVWVLHMSCNTWCPWAAYMRLDLVMESVVPVVMVGVLSIYGLVITVIINTGLNLQSTIYYFF